MPCSTSRRSIDSGPATRARSTTSTSGGRATCSVRPARRVSSGWSTRAPSARLASKRVTRSASADERSFPDVRHLYGSYKRSKYVAEHEVLRAIAEGLDASLVLPTFPLGPGDRTPTPTGKLVLDFLNGRMPGYVDTVLNVAHVDDVAAGQLLALERGRSGRSYILGGENLTLQALLEDLARITGLPAPHIKVPRVVSLLAAGLSEAVEGRLLRRHPSVPLEAARMSTSQMSFDDLPGPLRTGLCPPAGHRGAGGFCPLVRRVGQGRRTPDGANPLVRAHAAAPAWDNSRHNRGCRRGSGLHCTGRSRPIPTRDGTNFPCQRGQWPRRCATFIDVAAGFAVSWPGRCSARPSRWPRPSRSRLPLMPTRPRAPARSSNRCRVVKGPYRPARHWSDRHRLRPTCRWSSRCNRVTPQHWRPRPRRSRTRRRPTTTSS